MLAKKRSGRKNSFKSSFNGEIQVKRIFGKPRIIAGGMLQSGGIIRHIWKQALKKINHQSFHPKDDCFLDKGINRYLILGLGGGTLSNLINQSNSRAKIVGVEIDPIMINLGKKYFDLDKSDNLEIIQADAIEYVNSKMLEVKGQMFDVIFVDLYIGDKFPKKAESDNFLKQLEKIVNKKGIVVFNRLFYGKHKKSAKIFVERLEKFFVDIQLQRVCSNLLVFCRV